MQRRILIFIIGNVKWKIVALRSRWFRNFLKLYLLQELRVTNAFYKLKIKNLSFVIMVSRLIMLCIVEDVK